MDEFGDRVSIQILTLFPGFVLHQIRNSLAARQVVPKGVDRTELHWTLFGFADDDAEMTRRRLLQANLVGPAGFISMEDGAATGFVQRGVAGSPERASVIEMGGANVGSGDSRLTETAVRGLWKTWRRHMRFDGLRACSSQSSACIAQYVHALDGDQLEAWPDFFTENGRYRIATAENEERGLPLPVLSAEGRAHDARPHPVPAPRQHLRAAALSAHGFCRSGGRSFRAGSEVDVELPRYPHHAGRRAR